MRERTSLITHDKPSVRRAAAGRGKLRALAAGLALASANAFVCPLSWRTAAKGRPASRDHDTALLRPKHKRPPLWLRSIAEGSARGETSPVSSAPTPPEGSSPPTEPQQAPQPGGYPYYPYYYPPAYYSSPYGTADANASAVGYDWSAAQGYGVQNLTAADPSAAWSIPQYPYYGYPTQGGWAGQAEGVTGQQQDSLPGQADMSYYDYYNSYYSQYYNTSAYDPYAAYQQQPYYDYWGYDGYYGYDGYQQQEDVPQGRQQPQTLKQGQELDDLISEAIASVTVETPEEKDARRREKERAKQDVEGKEGREEEESLSANRQDELKSKVDTGVTESSEAGLIRETRSELDGDRGGGVIEETRGQEEKAEVDVSKGSTTKPAAQLKHDAEEGRTRDEAVAATRDDTPRGEKKGLAKEQMASPQAAVSATALDATDDADAPPPPPTRHAAINDTPVQKDEVDASEPSASSVIQSALSDLRPKDAVAELGLEEGENEDDGDVGPTAMRSAVLEKVEETIPYIPPPPKYVPQTWWDKQVYGFIKGTSFDPNLENKRWSILGYYQSEEREAVPDLPFLPGGDPPEDVELPFFDKTDFANTTWTVGIMSRGPFKSVKRARVFFRDDGRVVWETGQGGDWVCDSKSNVFRFGRDSFLAWNGRRSFPTLLTRENSRYYMEGFVIGWAPFNPLDVYGLWQAYRDDVSEEERGPAPWESTEGSDVVKG